MNRVRIVLSLFLYAAGAIAQANAAGREGALERAAARGDVQATQQLLSEGMAIDTRLDIGRTPLVVAATNGRLGLVQHLIDSGADLDARDNNGSTALIMAIYEGHLAVVKALINAGADVTIKNNDGWNAQLLTRTDIRLAATRSPKFDEMHQLVLAALKNPRPRAKNVSAAANEPAKPSEPAGPAELVNAIILTPSVTLDAARFQAVAKRAFHRRRWQVTSSSDDAVIASLSKPDGAYRAEFRRAGPSVIIGFHRGFEQSRANWIRNLEKDFNAELAAP